MGILGRVFRRVGIATVNVNCGACGTSLCGRRWCFACGLLLSGWVFFSATPEVFIGALFTALQRAMGSGRVAFVGLGASMNPPEIPFSKNGGGRKAEYFTFYGNLARDFALLSAV